MCNGLGNQRALRFFFVCVFVCVGVGGGGGGGVLGPPVPGRRGGFEK